jgi:hypothetical protein
VVFRKAGLSDSCVFHDSEFHLGSYLLLARPLQFEEIVEFEIREKDQEE